MGTNCLGDHLSMGTKYLGTVCPGGPIFLGTICPWGPNEPGLLVLGDQLWGTKCPGTEWVGDQMRSSQLEHIGKVIFDIPFMTQIHAESMKKILGAVLDLPAN